jgi:hypothetical protein
MTTGVQLNGEDGAAKQRHWLEGERLRFYPWIMLGPFVIGHAIWTALSFPDLIDPKGNPVGNDFIAFWSAARLALEGQPEAAYDVVKIFIAHHEAVAGLYQAIAVWRYPPTFLLVVLPLGLLAYLPALGVFLAATTALWGALIRGMFADARAWAAAAAFPAGLFNLDAGQNGFLTAGLAGFALLAIERQPVVAGILIGLLAMKPHLALLFPVALAAAGRRRTFAAAAVTALGFTAISIATFGWPTFAAFLRDLSNDIGDLDAGGVVWWMIPSPYLFVLSLGLPPRAAMLAQIAVAAVAAICVWIAWRTPAVPFEARAGTLAIASLLASPFVFVYDLTWAGVGIAWLVRLGLRSGFLPGERELLFAACVVPLFMAPVHAFTGVQIGFLMLLALLALCMVRCGFLPWPRLGPCI